MLNEDSHGSVSLSFHPNAYYCRLVAPSNITLVPIARQSTMYIFLTVSPSVSWNDSPHWGPSKRSLSLQSALQINDLLSESPYSLAVPT